MDGLRLLAEARAAGLTVQARGGQLVIRGPRRAEAIARRLLEHKRTVMAALGGGRLLPPRPPRECYWCGRRRWWRSAIAHCVIVCGCCHPPAIPSLALEWLEPKPN